MITHFSSLSRFLFFTLNGVFLRNWREKKTKKKFGRFTILYSKLIETKTGFFLPVFSIYRPISRCVVYIDPLCLFPQTAQTQKQFALNSCTFCGAHTTKKEQQKRNANCVCLLCLKHKVSIITQ